LNSSAKSPNKNGVDVHKLTDIASAIKAEPGKALLQFKAHTRWIDGAYSETRIRQFMVKSDEPEQLLGKNQFPNPVEAVLAALGSCLAVGFAYNAALRGINLESLEIEIKGDLDLQGFLGISDKVRPGYQNIHVGCRIKSDAPREKLEQLLEYVQQTSPVLDIIRNPLPVTLTLEK
jgi:uncharacterized OsmC-like protein